MSNKPKVKPEKVIALRSSNGELIRDLTGFYKVYPPTNVSCANALLAPIVPGHEWVLKPIRKKKLRVVK